MVITAVIFLLASFLGIWGACPIDTGAALHEYSISLTPLYTVQQGEVTKSLLASRSGQKYLLVIGRGRKSLVLDQDGRRREWDALWTPNCDTSGQNLWYAAVDGREMYVVINGEKYGGYDWVPNIQDMVAELVVSADGHHWIFRAKRDDKAFAVLDGAEVAHHSALTGYQPTFCPNGSSWAVVGNFGRRSRLILNDVPGPDFWGIGPHLAWSDSCQLAYLGFERDSSSWLMVGPRRIGPFAAVRFARYQPQGNVLMYGARFHNEDAVRVYLDDRLVAEYDDVIAMSSLLDGPVALTVRIDEGQYQVVRDTSVSPIYDSLSAVTTDKSGQRWVYAAYTRNRKRQKTLHPFDVQVVVDGVVQPGQYWAADRFQFSRNGTRLQYLVTDDHGDCRVVVDSVTYGPYDTVTAMGFSPDSRQFGIHYVTNGERHVSINGVHSRAFRGLDSRMHFLPHRPGAIWFAFDQGDAVAVADDSILVRMDKVFSHWAGFDSAGTLHFFGQRADTVYRVTVAVPVATADSTNLPPELRR